MSTRRKTIRIILVPSNPARVIRGHQPHRSGSGTHQDHRLSRLRTRSTIANHYIYQE